MIDGDRCFKTMHGYDVTFSNGSTIVITGKDEDGEFEIQLDPTDLSVIYGSYTQMQKELLEERKLNESS